MLHDADSSSWGGAARRDRADADIRRCLTLVHTSPGQNPGSGPRYGIEVEGGWGSHRERPLFTPVIERG